MSLTDACVHPFPAGDSSIRRMALEARQLGLSGLVAIDTPPGIVEGMKVTRGVIIAATQVKEVLSTLRKVPRADTLVMVNATDPGFVRAVIGLKSVHILRHVHKAEKYAFDHVAARMAADHGVAVDFDLRPVVYYRGVPRQKVLQRYRDVLTLHHRYEFPLTISTNSRSILDMRGPRELRALSALFDMDEVVFDGIAPAVDRLLSPGNPVRVIG
ncbi:ribonuclease P/MRP protein subunit RPP1 [Methanolinea mesophila]|uniref:RNase P subunit p30 family protein n=1 Tax=Methanolinea mesophila TaxID=547055 RepID=UPI001AE24A3A|nr:RNase P subunit p30 family protein [Methanolinea mesophila]MBP1929347.1 ribonuclease P/MRP protein subunit RPP1 [Methanolinea mesophila]